MLIPAQLSKLPECKKQLVNKFQKFLAVTVKIRPFLGILGDKTSNQNKEPGNCTVNRTGHRLQGAFRRLREFAGKLRKS